MTYRIEFAPKARRQLQKLPGKIQTRLASAIEGLADSPRPPGVKKLAAKENLYRYRVGDYRIIYEIRDKILVVLIVGIGHRREVYRG